jgi:hypothetical protein
VYDPYNPDGAQVSALFLNDRTLELVTGEAGFFDDLGEESAVNFVLENLGSRYALANPLLPGLHQVPEPSTLALGLMGLIGLIGFAVRRRSTRRACGSES